MALVTTLVHEFKSTSHIHKPTDCNYYIIDNGKGEKLLQIDTFGSSDREMPNKVSQSIQFSPSAIIQLKKILEQEL